MCVYASVCNRKTEKRKLVDNNNNEMCERAERWLPDVVWEYIMEQHVEYIEDLWSLALVDTRMILLALRCCLPLPFLCLPNGILSIFSRVGIPDTLCQVHIGHRCLPKFPLLSLPRDVTVRVRSLCVHSACETLPSAETLHPSAFPRITQLEYQDDRTRGLGCSLSECLPHNLREQITSIQLSAPCFSDAQILSLFADREEDIAADDGHAAIIAGTRARFPQLSDVSLFCDEVYVDLVWFQSFADAFMVNIAPASWRDAVIRVVVKGDAVLKVLQQHQLLLTSPLLASFSGTLVLCLYGINTSISQLMSLPLGACACCLEFADTKTSICLTM